MTEQLIKKMHPIHVILVHFPSALYPFAFILETMGLCLQNNIYTQSAYFDLVGAYLFSCFAIVFGAIDFYKINQQHSGWKTASYHAALNIIWFIGFTVLLKLRYNLFIDNRLPSI